MFKKSGLFKVLIFIIVLVNISALIIFLKYGLVFIAYYPALYLFFLIILIGLIKLLPKKNKPALKSNIIIALSSVFIVLLVFETILRFSDSHRDISERELKYVYKSQKVKLSNGWYQVWNNDHYLTDGKRFNHFRKINKEGFSDKNWDTTKTINEIRILGIGDSYTEGHGADADSTWVKFLEKNINSNKDDSKVYSFLNAGICGSDPFFEFVLLRDKLLKYKPDVVIFVFNQNDFTDVIARGGMERFKPDGSVKYRYRPNVYEFFYASSYIFRLLYDKDNNQQEYEKYENFLFAFKQFEIFFDLVNNLAQENNLSTYFCFLPLNFDLKSCDEMDYFLNLQAKYPNIKQMSFRSFLRKNRWLHALKFRNECYWSKDGHYTSKGYKFLANSIFEVLQKDSIILKK